MNPLALAQIGTLHVSVFCLSLGFFRIDLWQASILPFALVLVWFFARKRQLQAANSLIMVGIFAAAAVGLSLGAETILMIVSAIASLAAWDLMELSRSIEQAGPSSSDSFLRAHIRALAIVLFSSLGLALLAGALDGQLPIGAILGLALLLAAAMFFSLKILEASA